MKTLRLRRQSTAPTCPSEKLGDKGSTAKFRIVVMGAAAVGKSSIISQFLYDKFINEYEETIEELHRGEYKLKETQLELDILDTSGVHSFPAMRKLAIATSNAFVLVYSVDDANSFDAVISLREQILSERNDETVPIVIVANKTDKVAAEDRIIRRETAETLVSVEWGNGYVESSAKENVNIVEIFNAIFKQSNVHYSLSTLYDRRKISMPSLHYLKPKTVSILKRHSVFS